ncbi:peritrophin-1-like [Glossina fuscipes]|uniref:Peritrophin-1-like n=1 Tax=Glossina fuscipes TaxID=7396 RepID=A0A8U0W7Q7_9MUSC|nr:peritrophin-1-like [Glossina fuscipes]
MQFNTLNMINGIGLLLIVACCLSVAESTFVCPVQQADDSFALLYPSPTNCSQFYECVRGVALLYSCPVDLHFNSRRKVCDYPQRAKCQLLQRTA